MQPAGAEFSINALRRRHRCRAGFTLIEFMVVSSVIAVLLALMLPAIQHARESARRTQCRNNLHQIGLALHVYHDAHRMFPSGWVWPNSFGWATMLLPHLDQQNLYDSGEIDMTLKSEFAAGALLPVFRCPTDEAPEFASSGAMNMSVSTYPGMFGSGTLGTNACNGLFYSNSANDVRAISDGVSNTFAVGERDSSLGLTWWPGTDDDEAGDIVGTTRFAFGSGSGGFSSQHPRGAHFLLADGSARFFFIGMADNVFKHMSTIAGGETDRDAPVEPPCGGASRYCGPLPDANATANRTTVNRNRRVTFDGSASTGSGLTYDWDFGDGSTGQGVRVQHSYSVTGLKLVTLTVTDECGRTDKATVQVTVCQRRRPRAVANATPSNAGTGVPVTFDGSASVRPELTYAWDFGDGATGSGAVVTHAYTTPGSKAATLTVTEPCGQSDSTTVSVIICSGTPPVAVASASTLVAGKNDNITFDGTGSSGSNLEWTWDFGDGKDDSGPVATHKYNKTGTRTVTLTVTDTCSGSKSIATITITVI